MVTHAHPDTELRLSDSQGREVQTGVTDKLGSLIFRKVPARRRLRIATTRQSPEEHTRPLHVMSIANSLPAQSFYSSQKLVAGNGYITTRDGTKLSVFITLPGPDRSGAVSHGHRLLGLRPVQTGCAHPGHAACCARPLPDAVRRAVRSGGADCRADGLRHRGRQHARHRLLRRRLRFLRGVAAARRLRRGRDGGGAGLGARSQGRHGRAFLSGDHAALRRRDAPAESGGDHAAQRDRQYRKHARARAASSTTASPSTGRPNVLDKADPYGQGWEQDRVDAGDTICEENQLLHLQKVDIIQKALRHQVTTIRRSSIRSTRRCSCTRSTCRCSLLERGRTSRPAPSSPRCSTSSRARRWSASTSTTECTRTASRRTS